MGFGAVGFGGAPFVVINKAIGVLGVVNGHGAVFDYDALPREGDDAFEDVLVANA